MVAPKLNNGKKVDYELQVDYKELLGKEWAYNLKDVLQSDYMKQLMVFLHEIYKVKWVAPDKKNVFKAFKMVEYSTLKAVIVGGKPYMNNKATGIAYACPDTEENVRLPKLLDTICTCIEDTEYSGFNLHIDPTLEYWAKQGVLMLHTSLTNSEGGIDHNKVWRNFIREVIKTISFQSAEIPFLFLGEDAKIFAKYVDQYNKIYTYESPLDALAQNRKWECPHFKNMNAYLAEQQGVSARINW